MMRSMGNRIMSAALAGAGFAFVGLSTLPALADGSIVIRDFTLSHGIDQREPISETESFRVEDGKAFAFARIHNNGAPTMVSFVWYHGDRPHATVPVSVGKSPGWRVWSTAKLKTGQWRVQLVDALGDVLSERSFTVGAGSPPPVVMRPFGVTEEGPDAEPPQNYDGWNEVPASVVFPEPRN